MISFLKKSIAVIFLSILVYINTYAFNDPFANTTFEGADFQSTYETLKNNKTTFEKSYQTESDSDKKLIIQVQISMINSQMEAITSYDNLKTKIKALLKNDTRRDSAEKALTSAGVEVGKFVALDVTKASSSSSTGFEYIEQGSYAYQPSSGSSGFSTTQKKAITALNAVNKTLLSPTRPGSVPSGDLITDFIPGAIRIFFRFASLASLVSLIVSGIMFAIAFGNEERVTKAKNMIYYSLIGFACVVLAFAVVKAVTDIDFFGFI